MSDPAILPSPDGSCPKCGERYPVTAPAGLTVEHVSDDHHRWRPDEKRLLTVRARFVKVDRDDLAAVLDASSYELRNLPGVIAAVERLRLALGPDLCAECGKPSTTRLVGYPMCAECAAAGLASLHARRQGDRETGAH